MTLKDLICVVRAIDFNLLNVIKSMLATQNILPFLKRWLFFQVIPLTPMNVREIEGILFLFFFPPFICFMILTAVYI